MNDRPDPVQTIESLRQRRFPNALAVFCSGSVIRGEGTTHSDLDVVVVLKNVLRAERESLLVDGWPVELFIHDLQTLVYFVEQDCARYRPALSAMLVQGVPLPGRTPLTNKLQTWAQRTLAQPRPFDAEALDSARYFITDLLDDLRDLRPRSELLAIATKLHPTLGSFILTVNGHWSASSKHLPRALRAFDFTIAAAFDEAFDAVFQRSDPMPLIAFAERMLASSGGLLFAGYRSSADSSFRADAEHLNAE